MSILAEAYIHLKVDASSYEFEAVHQYLVELGRTYANSTFEQELDISVRVEEGSLKAWVTAAGLIYVGIAGYGSFRSGIDHLVHDGRWFGELVSSTFFEEANINQNTVYRVERRLGVPGKIQRVLKRIDKLELSIYTSPHIQAELSAVRQELQEIVNQLDTPKDVELLFGNIPSYLQDMQTPEDPYRLTSTGTQPVIRPKTYSDYDSDGTQSKLSDRVHTQLRITHKN